MAKARNDDIDGQLELIKARDAAKPPKGWEGRLLVDLLNINMTGEAALAKLQTAAARTGSVEFMPEGTGPRYVVTWARYTATNASAYEMAIKATRWLDVPYADVYVKTEPWPESNIDG